MAYSHDTAKFLYGGLNVALPVDLVPPAQWSRFTNGSSILETVESRGGLIKIATIGSGDVHSIFRLNQDVPSIIGERLVGIGKTLYSAPLPDGNAFTELTGTIFSGLPLSILSFSFINDVAGWAIIADTNAMRKRRDGYYQTLGLPAPLTAAVASVAGVGNLDSTGGIPYDWRYTYVNGITFTESNPSPVMQSPGITTETLRPTAFNNPALVPYSAFTNPGNAIDGSTATAATAVATNTTSRACDWLIWAAAGFAYSSLTLNVMASLSDPSGVADAAVQYSIDGGMTWNGLTSLNGTTAALYYSATLSPGQDLSLLRVRAIITKPDPGTNPTLSIWDINTFGVQGTAVAGLNLVAQSARICVVPPTDPQETYIRLYRRGGSLTAAWYFVGEYSVASLGIGGCGAGTLEIIDNSSDASIQAAATLELDNDMPVTSVQAMAQPLPVVFGPYDERVLGCGDPSRPEAVYFSKRGNADAWPPQNWIAVSPPGEAMMNGLVRDTKCFVFSTERMYALVPNVIQGVTLTPFETQCRRGLRGRWGFTLGDKGIYFWAKDGIYRTIDGGPAESIIEPNLQPLFPTRDSPGQDSNGYEAIDMDSPDSLRMMFHNGEVWCFYRGQGSGLRRVMIYDEGKSCFRPAVYTPEVVAAYSEPSTVSSLLIGGNNGNLYQAGGDTDDGADIPVTLRTGAFDQGAPLNDKEYGDVVIDIDPGGATLAQPVTITPYINGEAATVPPPLVITGSGRQRVALSLQDTYARNIELEIAWTKNALINPTLFQRDILYRLEPSSVLNWEMPPQSFGLLGWLHLRDGYLGVRSTADVTLAVYGDDVLYDTVTLASTGGVRRKLYFTLLPYKARLFRFVAQSSEAFKLYEGDVEVRVRQWLSALGYQIIRPLGGERGG